MDRLVLVKHSLPEFLPEHPAPTWRLGTEGRRRARLLPERLRDRGVGWLPQPSAVSRQASAVSHKLRAES